ncbi:hypothetical protein LCGC14_1531220, partial [marine sediment metagenome]
TSSFFPTSEIARGFLVAGSYQFLLGALIGVYFTLKNLKIEQSILKFGAITGICGGFLSSLFIAIYEWVLILSNIGADFLMLLFYVGFFSLSGIPLGLLVGAFIGAYYMYNEMKEEKKEHFDDGFFKDLLEE